MGPGGSSPPLTFVAIGLPAVVRSRYKGYVPPDTVEAGEDALPGRELTLVPDSTVGVEYEPSTFTGAELLLRLRRLVDQSCAAALGWITSATACSSLGESLDSASRRLAPSDTVGTRTHVRRFLRVLAERREGGDVSDHAYWLLKPNAQYIVVRHLLPQGLLMPRDDDP